MRNTVLLLVALASLAFAAGATYAEEVEKDANSSSLNETLKSSLNETLKSSLNETLNSSLNETLNSLPKKPFSISSTESGKFCPTCPDWYNFDAWIEQKKEWNKRYENSRNSIS